MISKHSKYLTFAINSNGFFSGSCFKEPLYSKCFSKLRNLKTRGATSISNISLSSLFWKMTLFEALQSYHWTPLGSYLGKLDSSEITQRHSILGPQCNIRKESLWSVGPVDRTDCSTAEFTAAMPFDCEIRPLRCSFERSATCLVAELSLKIWEEQKIASLVVAWFYVPISLLMAVLCLKLLLYESLKFSSLL